MMAASAKTANNNRKTGSTFARCLSFGALVPSCPAGQPAYWHALYALLFALTVAPLSRFPVSDGITHIPGSLGLPQSRASRARGRTLEQPGSFGFASAPAAVSAPDGHGGGLLSRPRASVRYKY